MGLFLLPVAMQLDYFFSEIAQIKAPNQVQDLVRLLNEKGEHSVPQLPQSRQQHPLFIPLTQRHDGAITGLLRSVETQNLDIVLTKPDSLQFTWLASSAESFVKREEEIATYQAEVEAARDQEARTGTAALAGRIILRVGPCMTEYENLAEGHLFSGSTQSALIACERNQGCFGHWGRPFAFHARILDKLGRSEEARDVSRHALSNALCTLGDDVDEICSLAQTERPKLVDKLELWSEGKLTDEELRRSNGMDTRSPQETALKRAASLLDLCVAAPDRYSYDTTRRDVAERYLEAGYSSLSSYVDPDETI